MNATKTWRDMLSNSLADPNFRKECEAANAELAELDKFIAEHSEAGLTEADVAIRAHTDTTSRPSGKSPKKTN
ncbi:MAG: hypothetical protein Q4E62_07260 [Sutterellaceae bacterium]|nr:hypothetical protein [Sutterellaceae bacterium]